MCRNLRPPALRIALNKRNDNLRPHQSQCAPCRYADQQRAGRWSTPTSGDHPPAPGSPPKTLAAPVIPPVAPVATPLWEEPVGPASSWLSTENYLILGTDRRAGSGDWRTDTIMIVGLDRAQRRAAVFSIPRSLHPNPKLRLWAD
ncbi:MAG: hypothetical protein R3E79_14735 [Caldilineaceae bacterium]